MPKGKGKGKGKGKKKEKKLLDSVPPTTMTVEELLDHMRRQREEMNKEREERNWYQAERDKIATFWEITKNQLGEKEAEVRNLTVKMDNERERHTLEIKILKQKVKHLMFEHQRSIEEQQTERATAMKMAGEESRLTEIELRKERRTLKVEIKDQQLAHEENIKTLKIIHADAESALQEEYERRLLEVEQKYKDKLRLQKAELDLRRKTELHEVEERKNLQIYTLIQQHEKRYEDMKKYYNDITLNGLNLINTLKIDCETIRKRDEKLEKRLNDALTENKMLSQQSTTQETDIQQYKFELDKFDHVKQRLKMTSDMLRKAREDLANTDLEKEVYAQRLLKVEQERNDVYGRFKAAIHEVYQKTSLKNEILVRKLRMLEKDMEIKDVHLTELIKSCNIDPASTNLISRKIEDALKEKNDTITSLQYELSRVCKAHRDLMQAFESRMEEYGIPLPLTGFTPIKTVIIDQKEIGKGPAGLVSNPL